MKNIKDFRFQKLEIEYERFGEHKGTYRGKIKFEDSDWQSFDLVLTQETSGSLIKLLTPQIIETAKTLANNITTSLSNENSST